MDSQATIEKSVEWPKTGVPNPDALEPPTTTEPNATFTLTASRLRTWGRLSALSFVDQGLTSGASFGVNLLLARWLAPDLYGAFAVAFTGFLFISGFHNVLLVEPMTVNGPSTYAKRLPEYFGAQLRAHMILAGLLTVACLIAAGVLFASRPAQILPKVILAAGLSLPLLLLLLLARRMCYVVQNPLIALQASSAYALLLLGGTFGLRSIAWLNSSSVFLWMACCSLLVSVFILRRLSVSFGLSSSSAAVSFKQLVKENWGYGSWLTLTTALSWSSLQVQTFLAAGFLGLAGAGILRAMQLPSLAMTQVIAAATLLVLPSMSQEMGRGNLERLRKKAIASAILLGSGGIVFAIGLFLFATPLEKFMFDGRYAAHARLIALLGLVPVFTGFASSLSLALRILRKSHLELFAYLLSALTAVALALVLMPRWGPRGAAASIVGGSVVLAITVLCCFLKWGNSR